ncbi:Uncharacterised protein [Bordetella pertussis]|nr:Uncharacterised protein [Bordetella pertussis]
MEPRASGTLSTRSRRPSPSKSTWMILRVAKNSPRK